MCRAIIAAILTLLSVGFSRAQERPSVPPPPPVPPQIAQPPTPDDPRCTLGRCGLLYGGDAFYAVLRFCDEPVRVTPRQTAPAPTS